MATRVLEKDIKILTKDGRVFGYYLTTGKVLINKGSFFRNKEVNSLQQIYKNERKQIINLGIIGNGQFLKDYIFDSPGAAISVCFGRSDNGKDKFYTSDNIELGSYLRIDDLFENPKKENNSRILICNITWMEKYQGIEKGMISNWGYVKEKGFGHEFYNFKDFNGFQYGYMEMHGHQLSLKRIDENANKEFLDDVLVVWISKPPVGGLTIVGYYKKARVYSKMQKKEFDKEFPNYYILARTKDCVLIDPKNRNFQFPTKRDDRPGRASIWYADNAKLREEILKYINKIDSLKKRKFIDFDDEELVVSTEDIEEPKKTIINYSPELAPKKKIVNANCFSRNITKAKNMLIENDFKCEINSSHISFIAKNGKPYMEAHHLIPLSLQGKFNNSLDVEANIICLCPNCHKKLHYGKDITVEIEQLFNKRKKLLAKSQINITLDELKKMYE